MLKVLMSQIKEYKSATIKTPIYVMLEVAFDILIPFLMSLLVDEGVSKGNMTNVWLYGGMMFAASLLALYFGAQSGRYAAVASAGFAKNIREAEFRNIQNFAFSNIDEYSTGGLITRMMTDVTNVQNAFQMIIRVAVRAPFNMIASFFMIFIIDARLGMICLGVLICLALVLFFIISKANPLFMQMFKKYDALNEDIQENINGIRAVKSFVREDYEIKNFNKASQGIYDVNLKAEKLIVLNQPVSQIAIYSTILLISWFGAQFVVRGEMQVGTLMSLFSYIMSLMMSLMMLSMIFVMIIMSVASGKRIAEVISQVSYLQSPADGVKTVKDGEIVFDNVSFNYADDPEEPLILKDINLTIPSGSSLGILGSTGSGKSSLVSLIPRLYDVTEGAVKVGGVNVKDYDLKDLRDNVAMVLQKNVLFSGTIVENMQWGDPDATLSEIQEACQLAQADEFIQKLPEKYSTHIEQGGTNVSGGQRQRLTIARALLKKPKILILDDSTSAVDTHTDALIRQAFLQKIPNTTRIIISQRISSLQDSDKILVLSQGEINGFGTHEQLLKSNEIYRQTYEQQQKGEEDDQ